MHQQQFLVRSFEFVCDASSYFCFFLFEKKNIIINLLFQQKRFFRSVRVKMWKTIFKSRGAAKYWSQRSYLHTVNKMNYSEIRLILQMKHTFFEGKFIEQIYKQLKIHVTPSISQTQKLP
jgi:hypothetical protein